MVGPAPGFGARVLDFPYPTSSPVCIVQCRCRLSTIPCHADSHHDRQGLTVPQRVQLLHRVNGADITGKAYRISVG